MAQLGYYLLLAAFVVAVYAAVMSVAGARRRSTALIESGTGAFYLVAAIMTATSSIIMYAFVAGDFSIKYVQHYSDSTLPLFFKVTSYWGGLDGSIMFWVFLLSLFGSAAVSISWTVESYQLYEKSIDKPSWQRGLLRWAHLSRPIQTVISDCPRLFQNA